MQKIRFSINLNSILLSIVIVLLLVILLGGVFNTEGKTVTANAFYETANTLLSQGLYDDAVKDYIKYLERGAMKDVRRGNVYYKVADIYFESIKDYEKAYANYVKAKMYMKDPQARKKADMRMVECLEHLGRSAEAIARLDEKVSMNKNISASNPVLAQIGDEYITLSDLNKEIDSLPPEYKEKLQSAEAKKDYLRQMVFMKALYRKGVRLGYHKNKEVLKELGNVKEKLIANRVFENTIANKMSLTEADVELYYERHKEEFVKDGKTLPLYAVIDEVKKKAMQEKIMREQQKLFSQILQAEKVAIFEESVR